MNTVTCTIDGESVTVVDVTPNGGDIYITAIDDDDNLVVIKKPAGRKDAWFNDMPGYSLIATNATAT